MTLMVQIIADCFICDYLIFLRHLRPILILNSFLYGKRFLLNFV